MKNIIYVLLVSSSLLIVGCQNGKNNDSKESNNNTINSSSVLVDKNADSAKESSTVIADDGTSVTIVPEDQKIYLDENTWMDTTYLYKITQDKEKRTDRKSELTMDEKNYYLLYIFPNPHDDTKVDLWYEEY